MLLYHTNFSNYQLLLLRIKGAINLFSVFKHNELDFVRHLQPIEYRFENEKPGSLCKFTTEIILPILMFKLKVLV